MSELLFDPLSVLHAIPGNHLILLPDAPRFTIVGVTDAYLEATYTRREEIVGKPVFEVFTDNIDNKQATGVGNLGASLQYVVTHKASHRMADQRYDVIRPQFGRFEFKVWRPFNKPVFNAQGDIQYIVHTVEDVTQQVILHEKRQLADQKRAESENLFRTMVEQLPVGILLTRGEEAIIESVNSPMLRFMQKNFAEEILGKTMQEALPELKDQPSLQTIINVQRTGIPYRGNEVAIDLMSDGRLKRHYVTFSYTPVLEAGVITGVLHVAVEVTEQVMARRRIEESDARYRSLSARLEEEVEERTEELAMANEELVATNEELSETNDLLTRSNENLQRFAYVASHDLQEPLRKIKQFGDLLKARLEPSSGEEGLYLDRMQTAAARMSLLIQDLLAFSRISTQRENSVPVSLTDLVNAVLADLDVVIEESGAEVSVGNLPVVVGDPLQFRQLFHNLLSNALKFRRPGVSPQIQLKASQVTAEELPPAIKPARWTTRYHLLEVTDNGIGFDEKYLDRIFEVFQRLHGKSSYAGTGIGLAICQKVVESHGGAITARSQPGLGTTFYVYLPLPPGGTGNPEPDRWV